MTVITVTLYSNPISSVAIAECPSYLSVCAFLCISERMEKCGFVCVLGIESGPSFAFQVVNPTVGGGWAARS